MSDEEVLLVGQDWTAMHSHRDGEFTSEELKNFHEFAVKGPSSAYKDLTDLGPEIKDFWIKDIWDRVNPGVKLLSHSIKTNQKCSIKVNASSSNEYTTIVYLNPDMKPEDGGSLELWTPNLTDKLKALACNTLYTFGSEQEHNQDLLYSFWPRPGRYIVFDSRIPYLVRAPEGGKTSLRLVFKGTTKDYNPKTSDVEEIDYSEVDFSEVE